MNNRLQELLRSSVEEYIKSATPISSGTIAGKVEVSLSPATIRSDLKTLEQMGLLRQIHTSGGRVPTTMGYRAYIDSTNYQSFAGDLINDLYTLTRLVERIDRKIFGTGSFPIMAQGYDQMLERRQNIYRLLEIPDLEMSAFYLIIKERMDLTKRRNDGREKEDNC